MVTLSVDTMNVYKNKNNLKSSGFTIVELLVVIVVIGILAAITIVSYTVVRDQARENSLKTDLRSSVSTLIKYKSENGGFPSSFNTATATNSSGDTDYWYTYDSTTRTFCLEATAFDRTFYATSTNSEPTEGTCLGGPAFDKEYTAFIYDLNLPGCVGNTVFLPITSPTTSAAGSIEWGDGTTGAISGANTGHTYATKGKYTVLYSGSISQINTSGITANARPCLSTVSQWREGVQPTFMRFTNSTNLTYVAEPPSSLTNFSSMFENAAQFNQPIGNWDVSKVTTLDGTFAGASSFNQPLNDWDVSNVTTLNTTFLRASSFNQPLNDWDVSKVTSLRLTFTGASSFNQPLNNWNTSAVTSMHGTFGREACGCSGSTSFNQPLNNWNTSNVTDMSWMFHNATSFNQNINNWDTSKVTDMSYMFFGGQDSTSAYNQPLSSWNTSNVTNMAQMFENATSFNQALNTWNVSKVTNMSGMFNGAIVFNQPLNNWNVSSVTSMWRMLRNAPAFNQSLSSWNTGNVTSMYQMFQFDMLMNQNLSGWNVSKVTDVTNASKMNDFKDTNNTIWSSGSLPVFPS